MLINTEYKNAINKFAILLVFKAIVKISEFGKKANMISESQKGMNECI